MNAYAAACCCAEEPACCGGWATLDFVCNRSLSVSGYLRMQNSSRIQLETLETNYLLETSGTCKYKCSRGSQGIRFFADDYGSGWLQREPSVSIQGMSRKDFSLTFDDPADGDNRAYFEEYSATGASLRDPFSTSGSIKCCDSDENFPNVCHPDPPGFFTRRCNLAFPIDYQSTFDTDQEFGGIPGTQTESSTIRIYSFLDLSEYDECSPENEPRDEWSGYNTISGMQGNFRLTTRMGAGGDPNFPTGIDPRALFEYDNIPDCWDQTDGSYSFSYESVTESPAGNINDFSYSASFSQSTRLRNLEFYNEEPLP